MSTIHLHHTTTLTPEQYVAGLTDFGPGRSKLFGNSADEYMKVHNLGRKQADVLKTTDSNTWGGASGHTYNFTRRPNGTTDIDVVVTHQAKHPSLEVLSLAYDGPSARASGKRRF